MCEKMLMARDSSRDETQKLHKKWLKHQAFMAELAQNKDWLDKIEKVSRATAVSLSCLDSLHMRCRKRETKCLCTCCFVVKKLMGPDRVLVLRLGVTL